ncbi:MAG TPA: hypothetical protein VGL70_05195 [Candidatus Binatia bacterium]|jgi:hypothetical protein
MARPSAVCVAAEATRKTWITDSKKDHSREGAKYAKVSQIPLFPPLSKGDERGISLRSWRLGAINFVQAVLLIPTELKEEA